jgi:predicted nucleotidyltransferase
MDTLSRLLSSRVKAELLRLLFGVDAAELHLREIARRAKLNDATVRQELRRLTDLRLVEVRRSGNRLYLCANRNHPLYPDLRALVLKTSGLADVLRSALGADGIRVAFVFGSLANGTEKPGSDIDLMVVGDLSLRQLARQLDGVSAQLGREINPHVFRPKELAARRHAKDHFISTVLAAPKIFVIGDDSELAGLGEQRLVTAAPELPAGNRRPAGHSRPRPE